MVQVNNRYVKAFADEFAMKYLLHSLTYRRGFIPPSGGRGVVIAREKLGNTFVYALGIDGFFFAVNEEGLRLV